MSYFMFTLSALFLGYAAIGIYLVLMERRLLFKPARTIVVTPSKLGVHFEDILITSAGGEKLHAWFVPAAANSKVILFCHGNNGNIGECLDTLSILHRLGYSTLLFDYRGYGKSSGVPTEQGVCQDALSVWQYLCAVRGFAADQIVVFGRSMGAAVATYLATQVTPRALVLESPFLSLPELGQHMYPYVPVRWLARIKFDNYARINQVHCPTLFIHSRDDELIPLRHGRQLYERYQGTKTFLEIRGRHADGYLSTGELYVSSLRDFLDNVVKGECR